MENNLLTELVFISPMLLVVAGALVVLLTEVCMKSQNPVRQGLLALFFVLAAFVLQWKLRASHIVTDSLFQGALYIDGISHFLTLAMLATTALVILFSLGRLRDDGVEQEGEIYALFLFALSGAIVFVSASDFLILFLGLEVLSMALYCLSGSASSCSRSSESALKYFFLGSLSSAFFLYGVALFYGISGTLSIPYAFEALDSVQGPLGGIALGFLMIGLLFKIGLVPFHFWLPDAYEGAPYPVTVFMAVVVKIAAVGAMLRLLLMLLGEQGNFGYLQALFWYIAFGTVVLANLLALRQRSVKRMLAYSSIAHAGYMLLAFLALETTILSGASILFYLVAYSCMTMGAFVVTALVSDTTELRLKNPLHLQREHFDGLGSRRPYLALSMSLFLLALAGLPPGLLGLFGKFYLFQSATQAGYMGLVIVALLSSAISVVYYLRVIARMYFSSSSEDTYGSTTSAYATGAYLCIAVCVITVVTLSLCPSFLLEQAALLFQSGNLKS